MTRFLVTETSSVVIEAPTAEDAERLYREYPLNPERQAAVRQVRDSTIIATAEGGHA